MTVCIYYIDRKIDDGFLYDFQSLQLSHITVGYNYIDTVGKHYIPEHGVVDSSLFIWHDNIMYICIWSQFFSQTELESVYIFTVWFLYFYIILTVYITK